MTKITEGVDVKSLRFFFFVVVKQGFFFSLLLNEEFQSKMKTKFHFFILKQNKNYS